MGGVRKSYQSREAVLLGICGAFSLSLLVRTGLMQAWWSLALHCMRWKITAGTIRQIRFGS